MAQTDVVLSAMIAHKSSMSAAAVELVTANDPL
jgi:hypothetical protein